MSQSQDSTEDKSFLKVLWNIVFIIFYPIITTFSLIFTGIIFVFSGISRLLAKISFNKEEIITVKKPVWEKFAEAGSFHIDSLFVDEIMFGPSYYQLRSRPQSGAFSDLYFGEFSYPCFDGILLQKWNTTVPKDLPNYELIFFDGKTGHLYPLTQINAFTWKVIPKGDDIEITWISGAENTNFLITKELLAEKKKQHS